MINPDNKLNFYKILSRLGAFKLSSCAGADRKDVFCAIPHGKLTENHLVGIEFEGCSEQNLFFVECFKMCDDELKVDPSPYRKNVKLVLQNMLAYCNEVVKSKVEISRPKYSQKIKLINEAK